MPRVSFGSRMVQKLKRVSLNHNLLENLQVKEGDTIDLYFDTDEEAIVIKKSNNKGSDSSKHGRSRCSQEYCQPTPRESCRPGQCPAWVRMKRR